MDDVELLKERMAALLIGICTQDFAGLHDIVAVLRRSGIRYLMIGPQEVVNAKLDCLLQDRRVGPPLLSTPPNSIVQIDQDPVVTVDRALASGWGLSSAKVLTVGIDPGSRPGVAYLLDGRLVAVLKTSSVQDLVSNLQRRRRGFLAKKTVIKVGDGDPANRDLILSQLKAAKLKAVLVDERNTTRSKRHRDEIAAIQIARSERGR